MGAILTGARVSTGRVHSTAGAMIERRRHAMARMRFMLIFALIASRAVAFDTRDLLGQLAAGDEVVGGRGGMMWKVPSALLHASCSSGRLYMYGSGSYEVTGALKTAIGTSLQPPGGARPRPFDGMLKSSVLVAASVDLGSGRG